MKRMLIEDTAVKAGNLRALFIERSYTHSSIQLLVKRRLALTPGRIQRLNCGVVAKYQCRVRLPHDKLIGLL
jgi:hypothetical protein